MATRAKRILKLARLVSLLLGVACLVSFKLIGATVDESAFLHEPFLLLVIGWLLIGIAVISYIAHYLGRLLK